jgi:short-subunit dehydrogenase
MTRRAPPEAQAVVITGASSGIGRACAHHFALQGARLVLAARSAATLESVAAECRDRGARSAVVVPTDVRDRNQVARLIGDAVDAHADIDVLVYSAGVMAYGRVEDVPADVFDGVAATALNGTANVARAVLPVFRRQSRGTMIVITSLLASVPVTEMGAYISGKWGQLGLARILQLETRDEPDIHVCTVAPGAVDTPIYRLAANYSGRLGRPPPPVATADRLARAVVRCADRPRRHTSVGGSNRFVLAGFRLAPRLYDLLVTPLFRFAALGPDPVGPTPGNVLDAESPSPLSGRSR